MAADPFAERLTQVRARFAARLPAKINAVDLALPQFSAEGEGAMAALEVAHRSIHELCGIGPVVGFVETGRQARSVEQILLLPLRAKRGLTPAEIATARQALEALRAAAQCELQITNAMGE